MRLISEPILNILEHVIFNNEVKFCEDYSLKML